MRRGMIPPLNVTLIIAGAEIRDRGKFVAPVSLGAPPILLPVVFAVGIVEIVGSYVPQTDKGHSPVSGVPGHGE
jgi:hypothetical protein